MNSRDKLLLERRIDLPITDTSVSVEEKFQNTTLRQILKFQNDLILAWFNYQISRFDIDLSEDTEIKLKNLLSKNNALGFELKGIVIGQFTDEEFKSYSENSKDLGKLIIQMSIRRFLSQR